MLERLNGAWREQGSRVSRAAAAAASVLEAIRAISSH